MWIVNQDHDVIYKRTDENLYSMPKFNDGICCGLNLYMDQYFLGTFDTIEEVQQEMENILNCTEDIYAVNGFYAEDDKDDIESLINYIDDMEVTDYEMADE